MSERSHLTTAHEALSLGPRLQVRIDWVLGSSEEYFIEFLQDPKLVRNNKTYLRVAIVLILQKLSSQVIS